LLIVYYQQKKLIFFFLEVNTMALTKWQKHVKAVAKKTSATGAALFRKASKSYTKKKSKR
jgi:endo-1,4-beta-mannosidase